jgi:parallel beta-helix repeat protein
MTSYRGGAIYIDATTTSSPVIVNNIIANTTGHGISSDDSGSRPIITNNTIVGSTYSGIYLESGGKGSIFNNIIAYSGKYGIEEDDSASDPSTVQHNLFYSNTRGHYLDEGTTTYDSVLLMDAYIPECDNNREGDPRFANRTEDDYHLQVGSPPTAINTGTNSAPQLPPTDFEGDPRIINGIVDIGADEFAGPTITSLSPDSATAGGPGFTLTVNGTHFVSGSSVVRWNGSDHPTTYVSGTQLTAEITAADIATAGTASVTVFNPDPGGGTSNAKTFTINSPNVKTLILTNRAKIESLYGTSAASQLMNKLAQLATHSSVQGLVVQVENDAAVAAAYSQWDANNTTPRANAVTDAIKNLLNSLLATYPDVEYIVLVGDDRVIPYRRVPDKVPQYQWREHSYSCVSRDSTIGVALGDDMTLTDDFYADRVPTVPDNPGWDGHDLYIPDYALGRLIETPSEIIAVIDTFLAGSDVAVGTAIVTGYDFVKDGAQAMCNELTDDSLTTDCTLIGEHWGRDDFIPKVLNIRHEAISINGHAKHYCFGAPTVVGCAIPSSDFAGAGADLARVIFYSVGCHAGLNVPPGNPCQSLDLAQAIAQNSANYVANTGYGWGDLYSVGLSEKLMLEFTEQLLGGQSTTLGEALVKAKHDYYATEHGFDYYDEKIMIEAWLLGLPMYRYTTPGAAASTQFADVVEDAHRTTLANGLSKNSVTYQFPTFTSETTDDCVYYSLDGVVESANGQPIQPKYTTSVDFPGTTAHGLVFTGGLYNDIASFDPCIEQALTLTIASPILGEQPFTAPNWHPATFFKLNSLETLSGMTANLVAVLGQFNPNTGVERLYDETSFDIYYHTSSDDWATPTITSVSSAANGNATDITVGCTDTSGIYKVVIAHTADDGRWRSTDLAWDTGLGVWKGSIPITTSIEYLVQAVDNAGNVASNDNNGAYHCALFGDFNGDVDVDVADIMGVANHWRCKCGGACYNQRYDMDGDCDIDIVDIMKVVANWGATCW